MKITSLVAALIPGFPTGYRRISVLMLAIARGRPIVASTLELFEWLSDQAEGTLVPPDPVDCLDRSSV